MKPLYETHWSRLDAHIGVSTSNKAGLQTSNNVQINGVLFLSINIQLNLITKLFQRDSTEVMSKRHLYC